MSDDKIAEIRARHALSAPWSTGYSDRATLLDEVDRQRAENERLRADLLTQQGCCDGAAAQDAHVRQEREEHRAEIEKLRAENERLYNEDTKTRHALKGWAFVCPDGGDEPTHERVSAVVAEVEKLRAEIERLREALTSIRIDGPRADGLVWVAFHHPVVAGQSYDALAGDMNRLVSQALLQFEEIRRNALEGKP